MDAIIKVKPEELTDAFLQQLKQLAANSKRIEIHFEGVDATNNLSESEIINRLQKLSDNKTISFTMEELKAYADQLTA